ncbi:MAG: EH signature domain-containing protein [Deferrisomatales bacterium]|nr:EH signature domain-containing protein [Deferrisomatales bacterium]
MPSLQEVLSRQRVLNLFPPIRQPQKLEVAVREAQQRLGDTRPTEPTPYDLSETYQALHATLRAPSMVAALPRRHMRRAPWVLFERQEPAGPVLADHLGFLHAYLARVREAASSGILLALAFCFLKYYPQRSACFEVIRRFLVNASGQLHTARGRRFRESSTVFHLLEKDGPLLFGKQLLELDQPVDQVLEGAWLKGDLGRGAFAEAAYVSLLGTIAGGHRRRSLSEPHLNRLIEFSSNNQTVSGIFRFERQRVALADNLLQPFTAGDDAASHRALIEHFLLETYGDLRLDGAQWRGVGEDAKAVMYRWMVGATLEDFFRLLDHAALKDDDADRQWPYRRAFWSAFFNGGYMRDAWVILGSEVAWTARSFLRDEGGGYGKLLSGYNVKSNHAVLLMRIDDLVISEWSHVGAVRVWHRDHSSAPKLHRRQYRRDDLVRAPEFAIPHAGAANGRWQQKLATHIAGKTGISLSRRDYMP